MSMSFRCAESRSDLPSLHHFSALRQTLRFVIGSTNFVSFRVGQLQFDKVGMNPCSLSSVLAMLRNPWPVICSLVYPSRRSAVFTVLFDIGRSRVSGDGNTYSPQWVSACSSRNIVTAWWARGTMCCYFIFIRSPGIRHSAPLRSNSAHRPQRLRGHRPLFIQIGGT